ncbi:hypothetical protein AB8810_19985 [Xanthomonas sp. NCPPB 3005]|uniref:hypothetical protein n=1 Tax=Xanthomonas sp. NCPPB 3005 TaxID=3240913 RepID=UPI003514646D
MEPHRSPALLAANGTAPKLASLKQGRLFGRSPLRCSARFKAGSFKSKITGNSNSNSNSNSKNNNSNNSNNNNNRCCNGNHGCCCGDGGAGVCRVGVGGGMRGLGRVSG